MHERSNETDFLMKFITFSGINKNNIASNLGQNDYSYFFVLQDFLPLLQQFGEVLVTNDLDEVDTLYAQVKASGEDAVFLSFTPPHKTPLNMVCPTIPVFAWEYSNVPNQAWGDDERDDWRLVLNQLGRAITHSSYSLNTVKAETGEGLIIEPIPAPVWDSVAHIRQEQKTPLHKNVQLTLSATVIDSADFHITAEAVTPIPAALAGKDMSFGDKAWHGETLNYLFQGGSELFLAGFYSPESWGVWSRTSTPWLMLPYSVDGEITIALDIQAYGNNVDRDISVALGNRSTTIKLTEGGLVEVYFDLDSPTNCLSFGNIDLTPPAGAGDARTLGIGLQSLQVRRADAVGESTSDQPAAQSKAERAPAKIDLNGVVYTSVFNPTDGRKDWESIVTAFCSALGDREDAILILKITFNNLPAYLDDVFNLFSNLAPFKCRIIVVHGFLDDDDFEKLLRATSYVVNTSKCEGQCLPLMEFMSAGKPAISPDNTAMQDYIDASNAFVVESDVEPTWWPHDPRQILQTLWYRVSWESIANAYRDSYSVAKNHPRKYSEMSDAAIESLRRFCSIAELVPRLERVLDGIADVEACTSHSAALSDADQNP